jgi:hypothetical protein
MISNRDIVLAQLATSAYDRRQAIRAPIPLGWNVVRFDADAYGTVGLGSGFSA